MFGWFKQSRIRSAQAILSRHINRQAMQRVKGVHRPLDARTSYCQVAYLIPLIGNKPQHTQMTPVVTHDISSAGISIIHNDNIDAQNVLIALPENDDFNYLKCRVEHCTRLSPEFVQIGLHAEEIAAFRKVDDLKKDQRLARKTNSGDPQQAIAGILEYWGESTDQPE